MRTVRVALLLCDEIIMGPPAFEAVYARVFDQLLSSSLAKITSDIILTLDIYNVYEGMAYPSDDANYDGLLISGARSSANDDVLWVKELIAYVKHIVVEKPSLKIFGICFGHQIICKALGSTVEKGDWEVSVTTTELTPIGKVIFQAHKLDLQMFHHDQVSEAPPHAHLLGSSEIVRNQGIVMFDPRVVPLSADLDSDMLHISLTSIHVLTLQSHPELTEPVMRKLIAEFVDDLPRELVDDAIARVGLPTDTDATDKVGRAIWGVLGVTG